MPTSLSGSPRIHFGTVRHTRLRPVVNAFSYRVCFIRLPLRALGSGGFASRLFSRNRFNLMAFHDADHGDGGPSALAWVDALLRREGIDDADGEIWLQTFPRMFGYVFNPVSFWLCHQADGALRAILCEVSNTFGERHCYLLDRGKPMPFGIELVARKVFHVSPFCKVEGDYRFRFMQAGTDGDRVCVRIEHDDAAGPLLRTSISGTGLPISDRSVLKALLAYPLMTLAVVARIHWQALRLWMRRVPFFKKPEPPLQEITR